MLQMRSCMLGFGGVRLQQAQLPDGSGPADVQRLMARNLGAVRHWRRARHRLHDRSTTSEAVSMNSAAMCTRSATMAS